MACHLAGTPSHYLNQCWYIVNWTLGHKLQWNLNPNLYIFIQEFQNAFENGVWKMVSVLSQPQCVDMNKVFMLVYSRSVTRPDMDQNWLLLPALGRFGTKLFWQIMGWKKLHGNMCWVYVGTTLGPYWPYIVSPTSLRHGVDVARQLQPNIGSTSVTIVENNLNFIIKTNRNVPQQNTMIHFCPQSNWIMTTDHSTMLASLWNRCKQFLTAKNGSWCPQRGQRMLCKWSQKSGSESMNKLKCQLCIFQHFRNYIHQHRPITAFWLVFSIFLYKKFCLNISY